MVWTKAISALWLLQQRGDGFPAGICEGEQQVLLFFLFNELELLTPVDLEQRFKVTVSEMEIVTLRKT